MLAHSLQQGYPGFLLLTEPAIILPTNALDGMEIRSVISPDECDLPAWIIPELKLELGPISDYPPG
jgi:hypothetical protein